MGVAKLKHPNKGHTPNKGQKPMYQGVRYSESPLYSDYLGGGTSADRILPTPEILVSDTTKNSLQGWKFMNFPGRACPQTLLV